ncbi:MAG: tyrosine-type recombinase/integrase [Acholeplasma sp.]|nr:tyrosine-type recombinase/integrase [Acholeplasma sp.]
MNTKAEIERYIAYTDLKKISKDSYRNILWHWATYLEDKGILEPTRNDLISFKEDMLKQNESASVQKYIVVIRGFYRYLKFIGLYEDISYQVRGCKVETTFKRMPLSIKDSRKLIRKAKRKATNELGKRDYALVVLFLTTGIRSIEASRADVEDIDMIDGEYVLHIQGKGRDSKADYVKLSKETFDSLSDYINSVNQDNIIKDNDKTPLFLSQIKSGKQGRLSTKSIRSIVKELLVSIGYDSRAYSVHSLRHTFATTALIQGASLLQTQEALRHKNISTTQIYSHMVEGMKSNTNKIVSNALFNNKEKPNE